MLGCRESWILPTAADTELFSAAAWGAVGLHMQTVAGAGREAQLMQGVSGASLRQEVELEVKNLIERIKKLEKVRNRK